MVAGKAGRRAHRRVGVDAGAGASTVASVSDPFRTERSKPDKASFPCPLPSDSVARTVGVAVQKAPCTCTGCTGRLGRGGLGLTSKKAQVN